MTSSKRNPKFFLALTGIPLILIALLFSIITPVFAGPDDDFHLASIWCAEGEKDNQCMAISNDEYTTYGQVPNGLVSLLQCKSRVISDPPNCSLQNERPGYSNVRINSSAYPSGYYKFNSFFVTSDINLSILKMRFFNALIFGVALLLAYVLIGLNSSKKMLVSSALLLVPFPLFLIGTNNPQVWSVLTIVPMYFVFSEALQKSSIRITSLQLLRYVYLLCGVNMYIASRGDGVYILLFLIGVLSVTCFREISKKRITFISCCLLIVLGLNKLFGPSGMQLGLAKMESNGNSYVLHNLLELPGFLVGIFGGKGDSGYLSLGSYDLPLPSLAWFSTLIVLFTILFLGSRDSARIFAFSVALMGIAIISLYGMSQQSANTAGFFQPRYLLPFVFIALLVMFESNLERITRIRVGIVIVFQLVAFLTFMYAVLLRYSSGIPVEQSKYLELFALPNTYVSKSMINWNTFSGDLNGIIPFSARTIFITMGLFWTILSIGLGYLMTSLGRISAVPHK